MTCLCYSELCFVSPPHVTDNGEAVPTLKKRVQK